MTSPNIRIVLAQPTHPGNIGASARAMKNMALSQLYLINPQDFPGEAATARAAGADEILANARVCTSLEEAISSCRLVIGTSGRARRITWPMLTPQAAAERLLVEAQYGQVALVFGTERTGLTNEELDRCHFLVSIPSNPAFASLNLACAVQILAYEIYQTQLNQAEASAPQMLESEQSLASRDELDLFYAHLEQVLIQIEFLDPDNPRKLMRRLMRLYNRARLDKNEINILRGMLTAVQAGRRRNS